MESVSKKTNIKRKSYVPQDENEEITKKHRTVQRPKKEQYVIMYNILLEYPNMVLHPTYPHQVWIRISNETACNGMPSREPAKWYRSWYDKKPTIEHYALQIQLDPSKLDCLSPTDRIAYNLLKSAKATIKNGLSKPAELENIKTTKKKLAQQKRNSVMQSHILKNITNNIEDEKQAEDDKSSDVESFSEEQYYEKIADESTLKNTYQDTTDLDDSLEYSQQHEFNLYDNENANQEEYSDDVLLENLEYDTAAILQTNKLQEQTDEVKHDEPDDSALGDDNLFLDDSSLNAALLQEQIQHHKALENATIIGFYLLNESMTETIREEFSKMKQTFGIDTDDSS